jgi:hypothetical protein
MGARSHGDVKGSREGLAGEGRTPAAVLEWTLLRAGIIAGASRIGFL